MEPDKLKRGRLFHKIVQADYNKNSDGTVGIEEHVSFKELKSYKQKKGRIDIIVHDEDEDFVMIMVK